MRAPRLAALFAIQFVLAKPTELPKFQFGTAVLVIRVPQRIWVGADSLVVELSDKSTKSICKIYGKSGDVRYAFAGPLNFGGVFDAKQIADDGIAKGGSVSDIASRFEDSIKPKFLKALPMMKKTYPLYYSQNVERKDEPNLAFFEVLFWRMEREPVFSYRIFRAKRDSKNKLYVANDAPSSTSVMDCRVGSCGSGPMVLPIGKSDGFVEISRKFIGNPPSDIRTFISAESSRHPKEVGGDIDVLMVDLAGDHWLTPPSACHK